jgi:acetyl esterase/lipase
MTGDFEQVHPELKRSAKLIPRAAFSTRSLPLWRMADHFLWKRPPPQGIAIETIAIPSAVSQREIRVRLYRPAAPARGGTVPAGQASQDGPGLLWFHGGGYVTGRPEQDDGCCSQYAREAGVVVASVAYRLAPEHPFPAALEDGYAALAWMASGYAGIGVDPARLAVGGESAGGGLAAALAQLALDRAEVDLRFQLLTYPMLDDRTCHRTDIPDHPAATWSRASNRYAWESYLGAPGGGPDVAAPEHPAYAAPARRADLAGLPPAWIGVGTLDLFHDEDVLYARRLEAAGVACELVVVPGAYHAFDLTAPGAPVVRDFRASQTAALQHHLA